MEVGIKQLNYNDIDAFKALIGVFAEVFEMEDFSMPSDGYLMEVLSEPNFMCFVSMMNNQVLGGLTSYILTPYYSQRPIAYIYDLAVKKEHQRKGIGKKLMSAINTHCKNNGFDEVFVQAEKIDDYALDFYRSTAISHEDQVVHFSYHMNRTT
jgi:aminoglycoside 3-N-acetyltransferase I